MGTLGTTSSLYKQSFNVLSADAEIVLFRRYERDLGDPRGRWLFLSRF